MEFSLSVIERLLKKMIFSRNERANSANIFRVSQAKIVLLVECFNHAFCLIKFSVIYYVHKCSKMNVFVKSLLFFFPKMA